MEAPVDSEPIMHQFQNELTAALDKYRDQGLTFGEAIGALETVKLDLYLEQQADHIRRLAADPLYD
jgi:hypothetical protein